MAKKVRKPRSRKPRSYAQAGNQPRPSTPAQPQSPGRRSSAAKSKPKAKAKAAEPVDFAGEYTYVVTDLRRIFTLAAVMFVVLIALNFIMQ